MGRYVQSQRLEVAINCVGVLLPSHVGLYTVRVYILNYYYLKLLNMGFHCRCLPESHGKVCAISKVGGGY